MSDDFNKPYNIQSAYLLYRAAADQLKTENYPVPRFTQEDVKENDGQFFLTFDFDIMEEKSFSLSVARLKQIYNDMIGVKEEKMPKTFKVYVGENFKNKRKYHQSNISPEQPKTQKEKQPINKNEHEIDVYKTYDTYDNIKLPETY